MEVMDVVLNGQPRGGPVSGVDDGPTLQRQLMDILAGGGICSRISRPWRSTGLSARESVETTSFAELNALVRNLTRNDPASARGAAARGRPAWPVKPPVRPAVTPATAVTLATASTAARAPTRTGIRGRRVECSSLRFRPAVTSRKACAGRARCTWTAAAAPVGRQRVRNAQAQSAVCAPRTGSSRCRPEPLAIAGWWPPYAQVWIGTPEPVADVPPVTSQAWFCAAARRLMTS